LGSILFSLALAAYTVGIVLTILATVNRSAAARVGSTIALAAAAALQLAAIVIYARTTGRLPMSNLADYLMVLGWLVLVGYLVVNARWKVPALGMVLPPMAFFLSVLGIVLPQKHSVTEPVMASKGILLFHTSLSTLGMAAFFVAAAMSLVYVLQDRALKRKQSGPWLRRLPSLHKADKAGLEALVWGFPLFTVGIVTGIGLLAMDQDNVKMAFTKPLFPILAWAIFAVVLGARLARGFRGRKAAYLTITGFVLGLLTVIGINL